jgi:hypothetical protein
MSSPAVWEILFEWCADLFGVTVRSKLGQLIAYGVAVFVLGLASAMRWGNAGWALAALLAILPAVAARQVAAARSAVWRAACLALGVRGQRPEAGFSGRILAPTAASLHHLAEAVDAVRRARYVDANELVPLIQRDLLRQEEVQLLDAVRAMISMGLGSTQRAAQQAAAALPSGSEELDVCLGRNIVAEAWDDPARLAAIFAAWDRAGVDEGPLSRLKGLVHVRLDEARIDDLAAPAARELSDEARAVGADELAAELDARARASAYR